MKRIVTVMFLMTAAVGFTTTSAWAIEPARALKPSQVKALIQNAKTPGDHLRLAAHFRFEEARYQADVKEHQEMAIDYAENTIQHPLPKWPTLGAHCKTLVTLSQESAKEAGEMAAMHEEMARQAR